jgi:acyl carrier protein
MDTSSVFPKVQEIVADVMAVDEDEVKPDSSLINDLGAESIDLLDLVFRLERGFKVKIPRGQIEKDARGDLPPEEFEQKGKVTEKGMAALREYLSEVPAERFSADMRVAEIPALFTVETFCKVVARAQESQGQAASS